MPNIIASQERINDLAKIAGHYGFKNQMMKTLEEMEELKMEILTDTSKDDSLLIGELADVIIMTTQLAMFFPPKMIDDEINFKIDRQLARMEAENNEYHH